MSGPSLTPHADAARRAIELARERANEQLASPDPYVSMVARIREKVSEPLLLAIAAEMDHGRDAQTIHLAVVNVFANLAVTAGAHNCSDREGLREAALEILAMAAGSLMGSGWKEPQEGDLVRVTEPRTGKH